MPALTATTPLTPAPPPPHELLPQPPGNAVPAPPSVVPAEQLAPVELTGLLGHSVAGPDGSELGHIVDLLVDAQAGCERW